MKIGAGDYGVGAQRGNPLSTPITPSLHLINFHRPQTSTSSPTMTDQKPRTTYFSNGQALQR